MVLVGLIMTHFFTDRIGQPSRKRPTAKLINFNDSASTLHVSDDRNYVTKIDVKKYFEYFPDNLEVKDGTMTGVAKGVEGVEKDVELEKPVRNLELEQSLCGDAFWRSEISAISRKLDGGSGIVYMIVLLCYSGSNGRCDGDGAYTGLVKVGEMRMVLRVIILFYFYFFN